MDGNLISAEKNFSAVFFDDTNKPTTYPHFTSVHIIDGGLIVEPANVELVTVKGGHFAAGIYYAFDFSLFFEKSKANITERIEAFTL